MGPLPPPDPSPRRRDPLAGEGTKAEMNMVAAYSGFPSRYPHWKFGMEYERLSKSFEYGLSRIYELVINNDPCYAYLLESNQDVDQKLVMGHVYGHCDFFKNNAWFAPTNRRMLDQTLHSAKRLRQREQLHVELVGRATWLPHPLGDVRRGGAVLLQLRLRLGQRLVELGLQVGQVCLSPRIASAHGSAVCRVSDGASTSHRTGPAWNSES